MVAKAGVRKTVALSESIEPQQNPEDRVQRRTKDVMPRLERELVAMLDEMINQFQADPLGDEPREALEALRALLRSQVTTYMGYLRGRRNALSPTTSPMYADEVKPAGPVPTTLRGLVDTGTVSAGQAARLASYVGDRRTLLIFGDRATGKSTVLNALLELVPVDERFVSIDHADHLPALKERSFCVRLSVEDGTDVDGIFVKAMKMQPNRIVVGEVHADEILYFLGALQKNPTIGGFCTVRADSVHKAVAKLVRQMELHITAAEAKRLVGETRPVLVHMRSDERGAPRLAALWAVEGLDGDGEILLREVAAALAVEA